MEDIFFNMMLNIFPAETLIKGFKKNSELLTEGLNRNTKPDFAMDIEIYEAIAGIKVP